MVSHRIDTRCVPENVKNRVSTKAENPTVDATLACGCPCGKPCAITRGVVNEARPYTQDTAV